MKKKIAGIIVILAIMGAVVGISKINDDYNTRFFACDSMFDSYVKAGQLCVEAAVDDHNREINQGWGITISSVIVGFIAFCFYASEYDKSKAKRK